MSYPRKDGTGWQAAGICIDRIIPPTQPVHRDPCPRCGCRGDIDCGHSCGRLLVRWA
jgi:hypothetical protein